MINFTDDIESSYKTLINSIESVFKTKLKEFDNISNLEIMTRCDLFYNLLEDERLYLLFVNNKIKVFSSKEEETNKLSSSIFGDNLLLKNIFNNQDEMNKLILWDGLLNLYYTIEKNNQNRKEILDDLTDKFNQIKIKLSEHVKEQIIPDDVNDTTTNMVSDIIGSFQDLVSDNKNPFENIMGITTKISEKYYKDIEDGNIEVDKLLQNMPFPGKKNGMNMKDMMNGDMMKNMGDMVGNMMGGEAGGGIGDMVGNMMGGEAGGGIGDMMKGMMGKKEEKEPTIIDDNFSTSDVNLGEDELEKKKGKGMIGNMMNMANNIPNMDGMPGLGELGGMMKDLTSGDGMPGLGELGGMMKDLTSGDGMPGLGELGGMMKDLTSGDMNLDNLENMKGKMDNFMEKTLGVDMSEFNKNMKNLVTKMEDKNNIEVNENSSNDVNSLD